jgi:hypothetical protein
MTSLIFSYVYLHIAQPFHQSAVIPAFIHTKKELSPRHMIGLSSLYFGLYLLVTLRTATGNEKR